MTTPQGIRTNDPYLLKTYPDNCLACGPDGDVCSELVGHVGDHVAREGHGRTGKAFARWPGNAPAETVDHPQHYGGDSPHETIECLEAWGLMNNAYRFNAIKYLSRAGKKGGTVPDIVMDIRKAIWYAEREIKVLEAGS